MAARAAPGQLPAPADDALESVSLRRPRRQPPGRVGDRRQAEDTGSALTRALGGEEGHNAGARLHPTGLRGEEMDHPAPERQAARAHRVRVERLPPLLVQVGAATEVATKKHGSDVAIHAACGGSRLPQGGSELAFLDPRAVDGTRDGEEADATCPATTETLIPGVTAASDERGQGEALDVLDQRWPAADTALERARRGRG